MQFQSALRTEIDFKPRNMAEINQSKQRIDTLINEYLIAFTDSGSTFRRKLKQTLERGPKHHSPEDQGSLPLDDENSIAITSNLNHSVSAHPPNNTAKQLRAKRAARVKGHKYECKECGETFKMERDFAVHCQSVHSMNPYQCPLCNKSFSKKASLALHQTKSMNECGVNRRTETHNALNGVAQEEAKKSTQSDDVDLRKPILNQSNDDDTAPNTSISKHSNPNSLDKWIKVTKREHANNRDTDIQSEPREKWKCTECDVEYEHHTSLQRHQRNKHRVPSQSENERKDANQEMESGVKSNFKSKAKEARECDLCGKHFSRMTSWRAHRSTCTRKSKKLEHVSTDISHGISQWISTGAAQPEKHRKVKKSLSSRSEKVNKNIEPPDAPSSAAVSNTESSLPTGSNSKSKPFVCGECGEQYGHEGWFRRHMIRVHGHNEMNELKKEDNSTSSNSQHDNDIDVIMENTENEQNGNNSITLITGTEAEITEKKEVLREQDWSHITDTDLELKEFKCPRCSMIYDTTTDLFEHMRDTYGDPTVCHVCGKDLKSMSSVLSHSYIHQDVKPYHCPKCNYKTRTRGNLRVHFRNCAKIPKCMDKRNKCHGVKEDEDHKSLSETEEDEDYEQKQQITLDHPSGPCSPTKRVFSCSNCEDTFDSKREAHQHWLIAHFSEDDDDEETVSDDEVMENSHKVHYQNQGNGSRRRILEDGVRCISMSPSVSASLEEKSNESEDCIPGLQERIDQYNAMRSGVKLKSAFC